MIWKRDRSGQKSGDSDKLSEKDVRLLKERRQEAAAAAGQRVLQGFISFSQWLQVKTGPIMRKLDWTLIRTSSLILALSFVIASSVSTFAANFALNLVVSNRGGAQDLSGGFGQNQQLGSVDVPANELRRGILGRNVFNSDGELPPEPEAGTTDQGRPVKTADLDFSAVPCIEEKLPVEIMGTIYTGNPSTSFVTMKDAKVQSADIYKAGDVIIDYEEYEIYRVSRGLVELRRGDDKICVSAKGHTNPNASGSPTATPTPFAAPASAMESIDLDSQYVANEIGPGYSNILNSARLIPEMADGNSVGFKVLAIQPGSLFDTLKLQNGDVVAEVNGVSLRDPSQGFRLYQALQEEREVTIGFIRNGQPMTRKVRIK